MSHSGRDDPSVGCAQRAHRLWWLRPYGSPHLHRSRSGIPGEALGRPACKPHRSPTDGIRLRPTECINKESLFQIWAKCHHITIGSFFLHPSHFWSLRATRNLIRRRREKKTSWIPSSFWFLSLISRPRIPRLDDERIWLMTGAFFINQFILDDRWAPWTWITWPVMKRWKRPLRRTSSSSKEASNANG